MAGEFDEVEGRGEWVPHPAADGKNVWWTWESVWIGALELGDRAALAIGVWG